MSELLFDNISCSRRFGVTVAGPIGKQRVVFMLKFLNALSGDAKKEVARD